MSNLCLSCSHYNKALNMCSAYKSVFEASTTGICTAYLTETYRYTFKRDVYTKLEETIAANEVTFVLGPRKSGKTVCLHQYEHEHDNVVYIDIKKQKDRKLIVQLIKSKILTNIDEVILVDECTYFDSPAEDIQDIITCFDEIASVTKVVFSGSQSVALEVWANRSFAGNTGIVRIDFLNYAEWLRYKSLAVSEDSYLDFIMHVDSFYDFKSCEAYLRGCLNETVISNSKSLDIIPHNECDLLTADILMLLLYAIMFSKHNHTSYACFSDANRLNIDISRTTDTDLSSKIQDLFSKLELNYSLFTTLQAATIRQAIVFLYKCGLIQVTKVVSSLNDYADPMTEFFYDYNPLNKNTLFRDYNFTIRHPMFYLAVIKSLDLPEKIAIDDRSLLGSLVECHIKGLLSDRFCIEYHDEYDNEIDCIDLKRRLAIESTVSDRHSVKALFDFKEPGFRKILTTRTKETSLEDIERIPYYKLIYSLSADSSILGD